MQIAIHVRHQLVFGWYAHKGLALLDLSLIVSLKRNSVNVRVTAANGHRALPDTVQSERQGVGLVHSSPDRVWFILNATSL